VNILIVGCGAREHAMVAALNRSPQRPHLFCCGKITNPGIKEWVDGYALLDITDVLAVCAQAKQWQIDLAIIGPEAPLEKGLADALWDAGIPTIGPKQQSAQIETSKAFARELMQAHAIAGLPAYQSFNSMDGVDAFLHALGEGHYVVKANGLMGGKGVKVAGDHLQSFDEALAFCEEILAAGQTFIIEQKLVGQEFSFMAFCDGETMVPMPLVQDHKRAFINDEGPNTGGMGSYSCADHRLPFLTQQDVEDAWQINQAVFHALMQQTQQPYIGILYGSFIATATGIYVIEFNARFGDPESLNVLTILTSDFAALCQAMVTKQLAHLPVTFAKQATVCKYVVPQGYPDQPLMNEVIDIAAVKNKACLYLASVDAKAGKLLAAGSRTAAYVGVDAQMAVAEAIAEREVCAIAGPLFHREDIGTKQLIQRRIESMQRLRTA